MERKLTLWFLVTVKFRLGYWEENMICIRGHTVELSFFLSCDLHRHKRLIYAFLGTRCASVINAFSQLNDEMRNFRRLFCMSNVVCNSVINDFSGTRCSKKHWSVDCINNCFTELHKTFFSLNFSLNSIGRLKETPMLFGTKCVDWTWQYT